MPHAQPFHNDWPGDGIRGHITTNMYGQRPAKPQGMASATAERVSSGSFTQNTADDLNQLGTGLKPQAFAIGQANPGSFGG